MQAIHLQRTEKVRLAVYFFHQVGAKLPFLLLPSLEAAFAGPDGLQLLGRPV